MTKSQADKILVKSLFESGGSLTAMKWDSGRYTWKGSQRAHMAASADELNSMADERIKAIWFERRKDSDGIYCQVMCLTK